MPGDRKASCFNGAIGSWYDIGLISIAFLVAFSAYNTIQSLATSFLPGNLGSVSLGILYVTVAIGVWLSPGIANRIGLKWSLVLGLATYVVFEASLIKINYWVVVAASVVIGSGSGVLWVAVGQKIADTAKNGVSLGLANGVFWSVFQINGILGPLLAYFVLPRLNATSTLFVMFTAFGAAGTVLAALLRPDGDADADPAVGSSEQRSIADAGSRRLPGSDRNTSASGSTKLSGIGIDGDKDPLVRAVMPAGSDGEVLGEEEQDDQLRNVMSGIALGGEGGEDDGFWAVVWRGVTRALSSAVTDWRVRCLAPLFFLTGWELAFWSGEFPQIISKHDVPLTATVVGVGEVLGGFLFGSLSDRIGRLAVVALASGVYCIGLVLVLVAREEVEVDRNTGDVIRSATSLGPVLGETALGLFAAALCFGLGDSGLYTQCLAVVGDLFPSDGKGPGVHGGGDVGNNTSSGAGAEESLLGNSGDREHVQRHDVVAAVSGAAAEPQPVGGAVSVDVFAMF